MRRYPLIRTRGRPRGPSFALSAVLWGLACVLGLCIMSCGDTRNDGGASEAEGWNDSPVSGQNRARTVFSIGRGLALLPHQHPDVRPFGIAVLSSLEEEPTLELLQDLQDGLTGLGWLPPADPEFPGYGSLAGYRAWWARAGQSPDLYIRFLPDQMGLMDDRDDMADDWWQHLEASPLQVDLVVLAGTRAVRSYRYRESRLSVPVFHHGLAPADTRFLAEGGNPSRHMYSLAGEQNIYEDADDLANLASCSSILVPGDFDPLELMAFKKELDYLEPLLGVRLLVADRDMLVVNRDNRELAGFINDTRSRGILVARNMGRDLQDRVLDLSSRYRIPLFASAGTPDSIRSQALLSRMERGLDRAPRMMALRIVEVLSGFEPGQQAVRRTLPVRLNQEVAHRLRIRMPARLIMGLPYVPEVSR